MAGEQDLIIVVEDEHSGSRVDFVIAQHLEITRSQSQKMIREQRVSLDQTPVKPKQLLNAGQVLTVSIEKKSSSGLDPRPLDLNILYEDKQVLVVNKQAGIVVHPGAGTSDTTLVEGVAHYLGDAAKDLPGPADRPGVVHRLDKDTSGVMVFAKTTPALAALAKQFAEKTNLREYFAICYNRPTWERNSYESYLGRDLRYRTRYRSISTDDYEELEEEKKGSYRFARSHFVLKTAYGKSLSLMTVKLETGRTHQIRVHCRDLRIPIVGDQDYAAKQTWHPSTPRKVVDYSKRISRQMLHARLLGFAHPDTGKKLAFEVPLPGDMVEFIKVLDENTDKLS